MWKRMPHLMQQRMSSGKVKITNKASFYNHCIKNVGQHRDAPTKNNLKFNSPQMSSDLNSP